MRSPFAALALVALVLLGCEGGETPPVSQDEPGGAEAVREPPSTTLRHGEAVTYAPGEVVPSETTIRCLSRDGHALGAVVPLPGRGVIALGDPAEGGAGASLRLTTLPDGTVEASCADG